MAELPKQRLVYWPLLVTLLTVLVDQVSKYFAVHFLKPLGPTGIPLLGSFLRLVYLENTGVSFGRLREYSSLITLFSIAVVVGLLIGYRYLLSSSRWANLALGLILGGAVGNLIDRILTALRLGLANAYVVDFVDLKYFAVFNVADSALTVGGILFGLHLLFYRGRSSADVQGEDGPWKVEEQSPAD